MRAASAISLLLVLLLVSLSAYLRLDHSGIGCSPWPQCYGNIGLPAESADAADAYQRLLEEARRPGAWATPLHRLVAAVLGLIVLALTLLSYMRRRDRVITSLLLLSTLTLAILGVRSGGLHDPAIVMGNLAGGFLMLGLLGWMVLRKPRDAGGGLPGIRNLSLLALCMLCLQIFVGGLTSANFAASACRTLPDCHGSWLPGTNLATAFDLSRTHVVGDTGMVRGGPERADIHKLHRILGVLTLIAVLAAAVAAIREGGDVELLGIALAAVVVLQFAVGVAAIAWELPIVLAVAHNWLAALLLLCLIRVFAEAQAGSA